MGMLSKLHKPQPDRDRVVILEENGLADIATVYDSDDISIYADSATQEYAIPRSELISYVGPKGRIYLLAAKPEYVEDTRRLAALERSIVLRQVTHYAKPPEQEKGGINIRQIMLYALIGVLVLAVIFK